MSVDSLKPTISATALATLSSIVFSGSGGFYKANIDNGNMTLETTGLEEEVDGMFSMTRQQNAFVSTMNEAINSTGNVNITVLDHNDPASQNVVVGDSGSSPNSANPGSHSIDVGDMHATGTTGLVTAQSMLAHEIAEGKAMQVDGRSAGAAHTINARAAESRVTGFSVGMTTVNSPNGVITSLTVPITRGFNNIQNVQINVTGGQVTGTANNNR